MKPSRRMFLMGAGAGLAAPAMYAWTRQFAGDFFEDARALDASLHRRYGNPLRLPGNGNWMTPVRANSLSSLAAVPASQVLRGSRATPLWAYRAESRGQVLFNPLLVARPGDQVALRFENGIPQPSTVHWHGFLNDEHNDGGGMTLIPQGGHRDYQWTVRNGAGLNWYHPHPHEHAGEQLWRGLGGLFIVEDEASDRLRQLLGVKFGETDLPLVIQDRTVSRQGEMPYADSEMIRALRGMEEMSRLSYESLCRSTGNRLPFHGMRGDDILVNATRFPFVTMPRRWVRFRVLNASNARVYRLAFQQQGKTLPHVLLGTDGGLLRSPLEATNVFLAPAQRVDIAIDLRQAEVGDLWLKTLPFDPMHNDLRAPPTQMAFPSASPRHAHGAQGEGLDESILRIDVKESASAEGQLPFHIADLGGAPVFDGTRRDFLLDHDAEGQWHINGATFHQAQGNFQVARGAREVWTLRNATASMPHPMHLHGFSFDVLARESSPRQLASLAVDRHGRTAQDLGRVDTVLVWPGETVHVGIHFAHSFQGAQRYMFHCHNLEHEDLGMMLGFSVL